MTEQEIDKRLLEQDKVIRDLLKVIGTSAACKCGAPIFWVVTKNGKKMPVSADTYRPHWADCPIAGQFRKKEVAA